MLNILIVLETYRVRKLNIIYINEDIIYSTSVNTIMFKQCKTTVVVNILPMLFSLTCLLKII